MSRKIHYGLLAILILLGISAGTASTAGEELSAAETWKLVEDLQSDEAGTRARARKRLIEASDVSVAPALVELLFFRKIARPEAEAVLRELFATEVRSKRGSSYQGWFELIGSRSDIVPKRGYLEFKAREYARIDPAFAEFLNPRHPRTIRPEEIIFGGVPRDGIPALRNPRVIPASEAYLGEEEIVFGVEIAGEARAYPKRIMASHEMANDIVGGQNVSLAYCTLCGSAVMYATTLRDGESYTFGTSGLLYRSNKLMYDHQTNTLWSQLLGEPVMGPLVGKGKKLEILPIAQTSWRDWRERHPGTKVLSFDTGHARDYSGRAYADYFESDELMFPVWKRGGPLEPKDWVYVVDLGGRRRAYPLETLESSTLLHDEIAGVPILLVTDGEHGTVRGYRTGRYRVSVDESGQLVDQDGLEFELTESALVSREGSIRLERVPGHLGYWFGLYAQYPDLELHTGR